MTETPNLRLICKKPFFNAMDEISHGDLSGVICAVGVKERIESCELLGVGEDLGREMCFGGNWEA